jgi:RND family efflux transporter MFP subunit
MKIKDLALVTLIVLAASCGDKSKKTENAGEEIPQVKVTTVTSRSVVQSDVYTATVESEVKNNISPNVPYRIERIYCEVGDQVRKGQLLVQLDASNLRQLKLQIDNQTVEFNRTKSLYEVGGVSKAEFDNVKTQLDVLNTQYKQLAQNTRLLAPISGIVTARNYDNGDMYSGTPIITIEQTNPVKVIVNISEMRYKDIKKGQKIDITLDAYEGEHFEGTVTVITPIVDPVTHTFPIEVRINNASQKVRPGMFARATINYGSKDHVMVPDEALVKQIGAGDRYVYVLNPSDNTVSYNKVTLGKHFDDMYEIIEGVPSGSQVVIAGQSRLANGRKVTVVK